MDSWYCILNILVCSGDSFRISQVFMLRGLDCGLPYLSYILKLFQYSMVHPLFHIASLLGSLERGLFN